MVNAERLRLDEADSGGVPWSRWGPYLSEWQWGTVREDYGSGDLWNGRDPILKERLFGLTNAEGNHGEDVKECYGYFHGDNGAGIGASHQTGWTGTAGLLPLLFRGVSAEGLRTGGRGAIKRAASGRRMEAAR